jgi:hypothetical protein
MKGAVAVVKMLSAVCVLLLVQGQSVLAQKGASTEPTKTIVADLLDIDRDLYIVRGERGEIQIEATYKTEVTEEFEYGDRIKALVLMNNKALKIERAGPDDVSGVVEHVASSSSGADQAPAKAAGEPAGAQGDDTKVVEGQVLMVDGDFYVLRGELGEIRVERTPKTKMTEEFKFGDFIKATLKPNDQALTIERLAP